jgi:hypothetical protein
LTITSAGDVDIAEELNRSTVTGTANLVPLCYGVANAIGGLFSSTGNVTSVRTGAGTYEITIAGHSFNAGSNVALVTPYGGGARMFNITSSAGKLLVNIYNSAGTPVDTHFHFLVYVL